MYAAGRGEVGGRYEEGGGEFDPLQFVLNQIQLSQLVDGRKALVSRETLGIVAVGGPPVATTTVEAEW